MIEKGGKLGAKMVGKSEENRKKMVANRGEMKLKMGREERQKRGER